ncbi:dephospho-CoA kinase [Aliibacillus thermotolerans]|uniref:Dephospho-CoA kinase n=1 Tax=Aliibacillus thermotolerans TaxID=1834418 RepID=A0ABW0U8Q2_9BACI|nr:dephospho-CoA kinase [Aliibacillus thermotolerans]MDA3129834.1 dephospho-CoA kinase [Aliibacillus thermotolerans]
MIIGLTGGIASGKSFIANELEKKGFPVIDADKVAREVVEPGEDAFHQIVETFGKEVVGEDGTLLRKKLGKMIFADEEKRQALNNIVHPAIRKRMIHKKEQLEKEGAEVIVLDIPLLVENKSFHVVDKVLLVYVDEDVQKERLMERDKQGEEDANNRIASQMPLKEKKAFADAIIDNNGTKEESIRQLNEILKKWNLE